MDGIPGVHDFDRKSNYISQKSVGHQAGYTVKEEETRSVGSDNKQEIDAEIARLMRLRRRLDESQNERDIGSVEYDRQRSVTSETELKRNIDPPPALPDTQHRSSELFQSEKTGCQGQFRITTDHRPAQASHDRQIPRQIYMRNFEPSVGQPTIQTVADGTMKDSAERPQYQERYRTVKRENVREEETDSMKKERSLFQARKDKEMLLKAREDMLIEKENKLKEREKDLDLLERIKRESIDPYENLLIRKERELEQRFREFKERQILVNEREKKLVIEDARQRMNIGRLEEGLEKKKRELDAIDQKDSFENTVKTVTTEVEGNKVLKQEIAAEKSTIGITTQDKPFIFPKISTFSAEDPKPKSESSFEEWKYEVNCLKKDQMYSEAVICFSSGFHCRVITGSLMRLY